MAKSIINADDGSVSGVPGIKTSGGDENSLVIQSVGSDVVELNGTGLDLLTGAIKANGNSVIDTSGNIDATQVSVGGSTVIDTSGNVDATQVSVGGSTVIDSSGNVNAASEFTINGSSVLSGDSFTIPSGTTGERPASPELGMLRYNTDNSELEQYDGSEWSGIGGGAAGAELVATGSIPSAGTSVILRSDGTVEAVSTESIAEDVSSSTVFESGVAGNISATYDSAAGKVVIAYEEDSAGRAVVGTVSGSSISFGSPTVFELNTPNSVSATYDSAAGKVVIAYEEDGDGVAVVGTVSGNSISFGSSTIFVNGTGTDLISATYDSAAGKVVIAFRDDNGDGEAVVGTVSGSSISFGSPTAFETNSLNYVSATYDSAAGKVVIAYRDNINLDGRAIVGTVSGSSISFGSSVFFETGDTNNISATYDSAAGKVVIAYRYANNDDGRAVVGTVSGSSISFGGSTIFESNIGGFPHLAATYDSTADKVVITYQDDNNSQYGTAVVGTVSGSSISFDSPIVFESNNTEEISATYDSAADKVVIAYRNTNNYYGRAITYNPAYVGTNADDFIGFAQDSAADTDTVLVATNQQIDANQTGLTPKSTYYVDTDGTLTTSDTGLPVAGFALDSNTLRVGG